MGGPFFVGKDQCFQWLRGFVGNLVGSGFRTQGLQKREFSAILSLFLSDLWTRLGESGKLNLNDNKPLRKMNFWTVCFSIGRQEGLESKSRWVPAL